MKKLLLLWLLAGSFLIANAGIITVTNTNDAGAGSLRQAISDAVSGDTINFDPSLITGGNDTIILASQITFAKNLTLNGLYNATDSLFISGKISSRIFTINSTGFNINLNSMIFIESGIGSVLSVSSVTAKKCIFKNNISTATYSGNAINISGSTSSLTIDSCVFIRNVSNGNRGGALYSINPVNISVTNSDFKNNKATGDGGTAYFFDPSGSFIFNNNIIENDTSVSGYGGSLYVRNGINIPVFSFRNNQFSGCRGQLGGALYLSGHSSSIRTMSKCTFEGNYSGNNGGAIYLQSLNTLNIDSCVINNNYSNAWGGGFQAGVTNLNISNTSISNNTANQNDGGFIAGSNVSIVNSSVYGNHANNARGGFSGSNITITNSTIVKNSAGNVHGIGTFSSINITNSTIAYNSSVIGQGGINASTKNIKNSIIAFNTSSDPQPNINGSITSLGYNIFEHAVSGSVASDIIGVDSISVNLDTLKYNGGIAKTMVPLIPSVAIDAGDPSDLSDAQNRSVYNGVREIGAAESCATSNLMNVSECDSYTWVAGDGNTYTNDTTAYYTLAIPNADGCDSVLILQLTISISPNDLTFSADNSTLCDSGSTNINLVLSETDVLYSLINQENDSVVDGPMAGNGGLLALNTGIMDSTSTYEVLAERNKYNSLNFLGNAAVSYVNLGNSLNTVFNGQNKITTEAWIKTDNSNNLQTIVGNYETGMQYLLRITQSGPSNKLSFYVSNGTFGVAFGNTTILPNNWYHVAGTWDGDTIRVFVNGIEDGKTYFTGNFPSISNNVKIGGGLSNNTEYFYGNIAGVRIWNDVRTPSEIDAYKDSCLMGNESNLVALYKMSNGSGSSLLTNETGNGYDGTLTNMNPTTSWDKINYPSIECAKCGITMSQTETITVNYSSTASFTQTVCDSLVSPSGNYTWTSTGVFMDTILNTTGCDSVMTFNLTVNYASSETITETVCDSLVSPSGNYTWTSTGVYMDTILNANNCDSVMTFNLTVNSSIHTSESLGFCEGDSVMIAGNWIYRDTVLNDTLLTTSMCDSIVTYTISELILTPALDLGGDRLACNNDTVIINAGVYDTYLWNTGDTASNIKVDANITGVGNFGYWVEVTDTNIGCSAKDTIKIDIIQCISIGLEEALINNIVKVYPNPITGDEFTINFGDYEEECTIELLDITGKVINKTTRQNKTIVMMNLAGERGIYFIKFTSKSNNTGVIKIIKQ